MGSQVVVLGGGYAGLTVAHRLERALPPAADLHVVDETGEHLIQHELHRAIRRPELAEALTIPLAELLDSATVHEATVAGVDPEAHRVRLEGDDDPLPYDVCAVCLGAVADDGGGVPGVREHGTPLKRLADAAAIRERFDAVADAGGRAVVAGAGLTGVQVAGELAAFGREEATDAEVVLLEMEPRVAPGFPREFQIAVRRELETRGVTVRTDHRVTAAAADSLELADGTALAHDQLVWTGGIAGPPALGGERPTVRGSLTLAADPTNRTFVVGDAARVVDAEGTAVPASAQAAAKAARTAARNVRRVVEDDSDGFDVRLEQFTFDASGWLVSVGDGAVAQIGPAVFTGAAAKALKSSVGAGYLASASAIREAVSLVREEFRPAGTGVSDRGAASAGRGEFGAGE